MQIVINHLPFSKVEAEKRKAEIVTPAEVAAWLDARERQRHLQQINRVVNAALIAVAAALIYVTIGFFTH